MTESRTYLVHADIDIQPQPDGSFVAIGRTMPLLAVAGSRAAVANLAEQLVRETVDSLLEQGPDSAEEFLARHGVPFEVIDPGAAPLAVRIPVVVHQPPAA